MIQANELRIGSRVIVDKKGNIGEVLSIWKQNYEMVCSVKYDDPDIKLFCGYKTVPLSELSPIPITPEVLGRCGFVERADEEDNPHWFSPFGIPNIEEFVIHLTTTIEDVTNNTHLSGLTFDGYKKILYLHQLQNLVFALTGQELKINEK